MYPPPQPTATFPDHFSYPADEVECLIKNIGGLCRRSKDLRQFSEGSLPSPPQAKMSQS